MRGSSPRNYDSRSTIHSTRPLHGTGAPTTEDASTKDADAAAALAAAAGRDSYGTTENDGEADTTTPSPDAENTQTPLVRKHTAEAEAAALELWRAVQSATGPQCYLAYHDGGYSNNKKTGEAAGWGYQLQKLMLHERPVQPCGAAVGPATRELREKIPKYLGIMSPLRCLDRISVGRRKTKQNWKTLGPAYNKHEQVEITFDQLREICVHSNACSYMRVGCEIRHYHMGTPMGEQGSCAKANGLCLDDELKVDAQRERDHGDSMRNLSLAFVDDKLVRVAYDHCIWSKASAEQYATDLMKYSHPLTMVPEPDADSTPFLETVTDNLMNDGSNLRTRHKLRPWRGASYRICRLGVAGTADMQVSTATATFMRAMR
eukprot:SAG31_NODE_210_length_20286_cov_22.684748_21_plen_375_part_00